MSYSQHSLNTQEQEEFGYGQIFAVLLRRWPWLLGSLGLAVGVAAYQASQLRPVYYSSMELIVEPNFQQQLSASDLVPYDERSVNEVDYATQLNLMRSAQFIEMAVARLQDEYPGITTAQVSSQFQLDRLFEGEKTATRIFEASFTGADPQFPQRFLEELKNVYLEYDEERQQQRLTKGLDNINEQLDSTKDSLTRSQDSLQAFRQNANLIDPTTQSQASAEALRDVQSEQRQVSSRIAELRAQIQTIEDQIGLSFRSALVATRLSQSERIQSLKQELQETDLALAERQNVFTDEDPTVQLLLSQQQDQRRILREAVEDVSGRPVAELGPELQSSLELGPVDVSLSSELLIAQNTLEGLVALEQELQAQGDQLQAELQQYPQLIAEYDRLQPEVETERETLDRLLQEREQITSELTKGGYNWQVVEPPSPSFPIEPNSTRTLLLGVVSGLFIGGLLAFVRETLDTVVRTSEDLKRQVSLPLIGILPSLNSKRGFSFIPDQQHKPSAEPFIHPEIRESPIIQSILNPVFRESIDIIGNVLQLRQIQNSCRTLAVTSGLAGEGKTTVTLGLAYSLARMNQRVLVIDADLRRSGLRNELNVSNDKHLALFLSEGVEPELQKLQLGAVEIGILPSGPPPEDPLTLLSSPRFKWLIEKVRELYDVVLIDAPPVLGMADATKIGGICDGLILVARLDLITQAELTETADALDPFKVFGLIANGGKQLPSRYGEYTAKPHAVRSASSLKT